MASSVRRCPGRIERVLGVILQCDASSVVGAWLIRPAETIDQWWGELIDPGPSFRAAENGENGPPRPLAMHAGVHLRMSDGREFVLEQLVSDLHDLCVDGLHWTPLEDFQRRERREEDGWDVTVPLEAFRNLSDELQDEVRQRAASLAGRPFLREDCTGLVGRVFGGRRVFADSPLLHTLGIPFRSGEPALPSVRREPTLADEAERLLRAPALRALPDPSAGHGTLSVRQLHERMLLVGLLAGVIGAAGWLIRRARRL